MFGTAAAVPSAAQRSQFKLKSAADIAAVIDKFNMDNMMARTISNDDKFDLQQNFRRYIKFHDLYLQYNEKFKTSKASRVWIAAIVAVVFAMGSAYFMGVASGLFGLYFYRVITASMQKSNAEEGRESAERWFAAKGLRFEGRVLYHTEDQMLEAPIDPFDDAIYN